MSRYSLLLSALLACASACSHSSTSPTPTTSVVSFIAQPNGSDYQVQIGQKNYGVISRQSPNGEFKAHLNPSKMWIVIEDGVNSGHPPVITAYRLINQTMVASLDLENISISNPHQTLTFEGFDSLELPLISYNGNLVALRQ